MDELEHVICSIETLNCQSQSNYTCHICSTVVKTKANLKAHLIKTHKIIENIFDEAFYRKKKSTLLRIYHCPIDNCKYNISTGNGVNKFSTLKQHYLWVHMPRTHKCQDCNKSFGTAPALKYHKKDCGKRFTCEYCETSYGKQKLLDCHIARFHNIKCENYQKIPLTDSNNYVKVLQPIYMPIILPMNVNDANKKFVNDNTIQNNANILHIIQNALEIPAKKDASTQVDCIVNTGDIYSVPGSSVTSSSTKAPMFTNSSQMLCGWHNGHHNTQPYYNAAAYNNASMQTVPYSHHLYHVETQTIQAQQMFNNNNNNNNINTAATNTTNNYFIDAECMTHSCGIDWQQSADNQTQTATVPYDLSLVDLTDIETQTNFQDLEDLLLDDDN